MKKKERKGGDDATKDSDAAAGEMKLIKVGTKTISGTVKLGKEDPDYAKLNADRNGLGKELLNHRGCGVSCHIEILRLVSEEAITSPTAPPSSGWPSWKGGT